MATRRSAHLAPRRRVALAGRPPRSGRRACPALTRPFVSTRPSPSPRLPRALGLIETSMRGWGRQPDNDAGGAGGTGALTTTERENKTLRMEREILKEADFFAKPARGVAMAPLEAEPLPEDLSYLQHGESLCRQRELGREGRHRRRRALARPRRGRGAELLRARDEALSKAGTDVRASAAGLRGAPSRASSPRRDARTPSRIHCASPVLDGPGIVTQALGRAGAISPQPAAVPQGAAA